MPSQPVQSGWSANREKEDKKKYKLWSLFGILNLKQVQIKILKNENLKKVYSNLVSQLILFFVPTPSKKCEWKERKMSGKRLFKI